MHTKPSLRTTRQRAAHVSEVLNTHAQPHVQPLASIEKAPATELCQMLRRNVTRAELRAAQLVEQVRPPSLRIFDQIPMRPRDHARQAKLIVPYIADQAVVFMGDSDCTSLLLGLFGQLGLPVPSRMLVLDFDARLLKVVDEVAKSHKLSHLLETRLYNAFEALPLDLGRQFDWFYTNPPYGSHNLGASARLFITRGCELVRSNGQGCVILPDDRKRQWTRDAMLRTQCFLGHHGWTTTEKVRHMHQYKLDDDPQLASSVMLVEDIGAEEYQAMPYAGRSVAFEEIPVFYGRDVLPPFPHHVRPDGTFDNDWSTAKGP